MKSFCKSLAIVLLCTVAALHAAERRLNLTEYQDKVYGAWAGQIIGASYGSPFEGQARNVVQLDHYLIHYDNAVVDDDYYYEMVALYGFERHGTGMTVEQLGDMWLEYRAGTWGSSEQARLALERGIKAPATGSPRYNRWFHTIGPQFSSDMYGMISPGMVNLAGGVARKYSHVNGYAEGSDGAVFVAACISEAFFETDTLKIVRQAAQLIDPRSNYRKAVDFVISGYEQGRPWREVAAESEARWRADYPQMNNSVANGALVALGILYGQGDFVKSINIVTQAGDNTDADCNAANVSSVTGAMHGFKSIPPQLLEPLHNRVYGDHLGPLDLKRTIDEPIDGLARRIAKIGQANLLANGARLEGDTLVIPQQKVQVQPLEYFDINEYGALWNPAWRLEGSGRGSDTGSTYLDGDVLVTFPRDSHPCLLERTIVLPAGNPRLRVDVGSREHRPWKLQVFVDDKRELETNILGDGKTTGSEHASSGDGPAAPQWTAVDIDLSQYAGKDVRIRLYQWPVPNGSPQAAYWRSLRVE